MFGNVVCLCCLVEVRMYPVAVLVVRWENVTETSWDGVMGGVLFRDVLRSGGVA